MTMIIIIITFFERTLNMTTVSYTTTPLTLCESPGLYDTILNAEKKKEKNKVYTYTTKKPSKQTLRSRLSFQINQTNVNVCAQVR